MTARATTAEKSDDPQPGDHEPDSPTNERPDRPAVTLHLTAGECHSLLRVSELGVVVFADGPVLDLCQRLRAELAAYTTRQPPAEVTAELARTSR